MGMPPAHSGLTPNVEHEMASKENGGTSERQGLRPSDAEQLVGDTAASQPLTESEGVQPSEVSARGGDRNTASPGGEVRTDRAAERDEQLGHS